MRYRFKEFEFDSTSLRLTQNGNTLAIRHNEAKVLALLLERSDNVVSKADILCHIWQNKVVSEQAVFQNISHLRNLFGNDAIKTLSKRGYQWQLTTELAAEDNPPTADARHFPLPSPPPSTAAARVKKPAYWGYAVLASMVLLLLSVIYMPAAPDKGTTHSALNIAYIPITAPQGAPGLTLHDNADFAFTPLTQLNTDQFEMSAELEYPALQSAHPFVLTGHLRSHQQQMYLDFLLKGPAADWQGQLTASSTDELLQRLLQHLKQPFLYQFLSQPQASGLKQANLSIAHQQQPDDLIILGQLVSAYIEQGELDRAMVMAEKLESSAQSQHNAQQLGNALLYQSRILTRKDLFELSARKLRLAIGQFEAINDLKRQADAWHAQSWLDFINNDYLAVKASLLKSAQLADDAKDKTRQLDALTYLSVLASKFGQQQDKYHYLHQAEAKMNEYQLPIYHFAKVPFHYAIFAATPSDKEPHLKQVLEFTALTPDHWVAQSSRQQLLQHYISQNRLTEAQSLVDSLASDNAENSYLKTILAQAMQQTEAMILYGRRTFEQAHLAGNKYISLDVALLLCGSQDARVSCDFYSQYIDNNATANWRRHNELMLAALNL
ncbi:transcriptional regulator [Arsukibacterium ikkense]|uniref:Transcriptional regulator n=1 Tax=Arsukibacterium ikkense TaxID=336831 RepID=A0A0M2V907_9GAMM|nr:winged helix-turn-helix domain-containing protein [Arsukibacterium ikkense]KKO46125.1 transcriptional regulator [Arsukibacterium ikkense]